MILVLCEDDQKIRENLREQILQWGQVAGEAICILEYDSAEEMLFKKEMWIEADATILDVELGQMDGMELARKIRQMNHSIEIIFHTGYEKYALDGYEVGAISYLLKPVTKEKLYQTFNQMQNRIKRVTDPIIVESGGELIKLNLKEVIYIESQGHYCTVYLHGKQYQLKKAINEMEQMALKNGFFKCHRSYIVNMRYVSRISKKEIQMEDGIMIPLARGKWEEANQSYINFYRRV